jgi:hypothetical protein
MSTFGRILTGYVMLCIDILLIVRVVSPGPLLIVFRNTVQQILFKINLSELTLLRFVFVILYKNWTMNAKFLCKMSDIGLNFINRQCHVFITE